MGIFPSWQQHYNWIFFPFIQFVLNSIKSNDGPKCLQVDVLATYTRIRLELNGFRIPSNHHLEFDELKISFHSTEYKKSQLHCTPTIDTIIPNKSYLNTEII